MRATPTPRVNAGGQLGLSLAHLVLSRRPWDADMKKQVYMGAGGMNVSLASWRSRKDEKKKPLGHPQLLDGDPQRPADTPASSGAQRGDLSARKAQAELASWGNMLSPRSREDCLRPQLGRAGIVVPSAAQQRPQDQVHSSAEPQPRGWRALFVGAPQLKLRQRPLF